jgi:CheY-like chemotaxis protein
VDGALEAFHEGHAQTPLMPRDALVVDDDDDGRVALAELLEAHGYTVRQAENGRVALDRIAEAFPSVLLLDLEMPVMDGWEVLASLERLRALTAIAVVVLSAGRSGGAEAMPAGVAFLTKPCGAQDLLAALARSAGERGGDDGPAASHP